MNLTNLIKYVSDKTMITKTDAKVIINVFLNGIKKGLGEHERIDIRNFGAFYLKKRKARKALNPRNQKVIDVPERIGVKFTISKKVLDKINKC